VRLKQWAKAGHTSAESTQLAPLAPTNSAHNIKKSGFVLLVLAFPKRNDTFVQVISGREEPFPAAAVRDLVGIVRAMYVAAKLGGAGKNELTRIERVGRDLADALELASRSGPNTIGYSAAWKKAEDASRRACDLVDALTPAEPLVHAARSRIAGPLPAAKKKIAER
jgi:hypothetical protein